MTILEEIKQLKIKLKASSVKTGLLYVLLSYCPHSYSQITKIDSLLNVLKISKNDTNKVNTLKQVSNELTTSKNYDRALAYANEALSLSEKLNSKKGEGDIYVQIGLIYWHANNHPKAIEILNTALKMFEDIHYRKGMADSYHYIGVVYYDESKFNQALKSFNESLKIWKELANKSAMATTYNFLGNIYMTLGNLPEGLKNWLASASLAEAIGDKRHLANAYSNIGIFYRNEEHNYPEALRYENLALNIYTEQRDKQGMAETLSNVGGTYIYQTNYPQALKYLFNALQIFKEIDAKKGVAGAYDDIGSIYFKEGQAAKIEGNTVVMKEKFSEAWKNYYTALNIQKNIENKEGLLTTYMNLAEIDTNRLEARKFLNKALSISNEMRSKGNTALCFYALATLDSAEGDLQNGWAHYKMFVLFADSVRNEAGDKQTIQTKILFETEKKDNEITILNKDKTIKEKEFSKQQVVRNAFIGGFGVMMLSAGIFFFQRNKVAKEKRRSDSLLLNILPAEVAEELKNKGTADAKLFNDVTVLFTDFKSFTTVSERLSPQQLVDELHACFSAFDEIMSKHNIEKIKTVGDAYLAVSGLPLANTNHAEDLVKAAIDIRVFMLNRRKELGESTFEIRIGVHSGSVVAGIVGVKKFAYDIWGDTVNTAARMEQNSEAGKVNISQTTYELVKEKFDCVYRGEIEAKNKGKLKMYFVN